MEALARCSPESPGSAKQVSLQTQAGEQGPARSNTLQLLEETSNQEAVFHGLEEGCGEYNG